MQQHSIDENVVELLIELATPRPFETFSATLGRFLCEIKELRADDAAVYVAARRELGLGGVEVDHAGDLNPERYRRSAGHDLSLSPDSSGGTERSLDELFAQLDAVPDALERYQERRRQRAATPDTRLWVGRVSELRAVVGLNNWRAVCDYLDIEVGGDSARRRLQKWVKANRPSWPAVPEPPKDEAEPN